MNPFKVKQLSINKGASFKGSVFFFFYPFSISIIRALKAVNFIKGAYKLIIKFFSSRLNIRFYNKLSKEVKDFKDLEDECIYT